MQQKCERVQLTNFEIVPRMSCNIAAVKTRQNLLIEREHATKFHSDCWLIGGGRGHLEATRHARLEDARGGASKNNHQCNWKTSGVTKRGGRWDLGEEWNTNALRGELRGKRSLQKALTLDTRSLEIPASPMAQ